MQRIFLIVIFLFLPYLAQAQGTPSEGAYVRAKVVRASDVFQNTQEVQLEIIGGEHKAKIVTIQNDVLYERDDMRLQEGESVILQQLTKPSGEVKYLLSEKYRLPSLLLLTLFFFVLGVLLGGRIGFTSIVGLTVSIGILVFYVVPKIITGSDPLITSLIGSGLIACTSLYLAHGINRRTTIALCSTLITLSISTVLAVLFVRFGKLFGMGTEETVFLQAGVFEQVNLRGLLLGGIIIGALGVLDDITTGQTAAIDELSKANHKLGFKELYTSGTSIGREHIASLINTLALAYVGASLPILLLFSINTDMPWWVIVNSEFVAEEIVRTLVGSSTLLLAVPISTWMAAKSFAHGNHTSAKGHACVH